MKAYRQAVEDQFIGTDDGMLVERLGYKVKMIMGDYNNIKITTPEDLIIAESIVKEKDFIYMKNLIFRTR
jgi:2-C-methyl-D-erythritol 4-phosphate cytidylyltransferase